MKKNPKDSLFSPDTIFFVQWGDKRYLIPREINKKSEGCKELKITDYHIPIEEHIKQ